VRELNPAHEEHWFEIYGEIVLRPADGGKSDPTRVAANPHQLTGTAKRRTFRTV